MEMNYDDIIDHPHHVSLRHKPMSLLNRAAQFAPFAALTGYDDAIEETARLTDDETELANDSMVALDQKMAIVRHELEVAAHPIKVTLTYFVHDDRKSGGKYSTITTSIKAIDDINRQLITVGGTHIPIPDIMDIAHEQG